MAGAPGDVKYYLVGSCDGDYLISRGQMSELFNDTVSFSEVVLSQGAVKKVFLGLFH